MMDRLRSSKTSLRCSKVKNLMRNRDKLNLKAKKSRSWLQSSMKKMKRALESSRMPRSCSRNQDHRRKISGRATVTSIPSCKKLRGSTRNGRRILMLILWSKLSCMIRSISVKKLLKIWKNFKLRPWSDRARRCRNLSTAPWQSPNISWSSREWLKISIRRSGKPCNFKKVALSFREHC